MIIDAGCENIIDLKTSSNNGFVNVTKFVEEWKTLEVEQSARDLNDKLTVVYLVSEQWMRKFREFMKDPSDKAVIPGMISNCNLLVPNHNFPLDMNDVTSMIFAEVEQAVHKSLVSQHLIDGLEEGKDFYIVSQDKWNLIDSMFSSDISVPRFQMMDEKGSIVTEIYPITVTCVLKDEAGVVEKRKVSGSMHTKLQIFLGDLGMQPKHVYKLGNSNCSADKGMEIEPEETELKLCDVVSNILESGDEIVVEVVRSDIGSDGECSVTAMEGDNISQTDNMSVDVDVDDLFSDVPPTITTTSLIPYNSPETPLSSPLKDLSQTNKCELRNQFAKSRLMPRGLSNLGNTCFMNATLQCFASLEPLIKYYTRGGFIRDMNTENILGTGGKLARAFSGVLKDLLEEPTSSSGWMGAVSPRDFKFVLGQKASQFIGYDQHDCQELATYLLDALHEDCNLVEKKPYVEKPEKKENESDESAARIAWQAHKKREDSYIVNHFSFLMKSHVECPQCQKVSTTFDPMVYLSVPIPCSNESTIMLTFVPLRGRSKMIKITLDKNSPMSDLQSKVCDIVGVNTKNLCLADVWNNEVYKYYKPDEYIDTISSSDTPYAFELEPSRQFNSSVRYMDISLWLDSSDVSEFSLYDISCMMKTMEHQVEKSHVEENYLKILRAFCDDDILRRFSKQRSFSDTMDYLNKLQAECKSSNNPQDPESTKIIYCALLMHFEALNKDLLISIFVKKAINRFNLSSNRRSFTDRANRYNSHGKKMSLRVHRVPVDTTIFQFREMLAEFYEDWWYLDDFVQEYNLSRSNANETGSKLISAQTSTANDDSDIGQISACGEPALQRSLGEDNSESNSSNIDNLSHEMKSDNQTPPVPPVLNENTSLEIFKRVLFSYAPSSPSSYNLKPLGSIDLGHVTQARSDDVAHLPIAHADNEKKCLGMLYREDDGLVAITLPSPLAKFFDDDKLHDVEPLHEEQLDSEQNEDRKISLIDCINSFTVREQLPISESYYCSTCKDHVQAYKECGVYFVPNVLVIHLKRFQFSSSSHRRDKIESYIDYPIEGLDLTSIVMRNEVSMDDTDMQNQLPPIYDLVAVSNHYGGLGGGHYTAHAKRDGKWYYFDDSRVSEVTDEDEIISPAGYVLYYVRRGISIPDEIYDEANIPAISKETYESKDSSNSFTGPHVLSSRISETKSTTLSSLVLTENSSQTNKSSIEEDSDGSPLIKI